LVPARTVFGLPFFILHHLKLRRPQKIALAGIFSLGMITITISLSRFIVYTVTDYGVDDADGSKYSQSDLITYITQSAVECHRIN
jgi:hypothetical protein